MVCSSENVNQQLVLDNATIIFACYFNVFALKIACQRAISQNNTQGLFNRFSFRRTNKKLIRFTSFVQMSNQKQEVKIMMNEVWKNTMCLTKSFAWINNMFVFVFLFLLVLSS